MTHAFLEHANLTVNDPDASAALLVKLFGWEIRWSGDAKDGGYTVHVGNETSYLALYTPRSAPSTNVSDHEALLNLNHLGVVVADIDAIARKLRDLGMQTFNHADYPPGQRFYFFANDQLEIEVISYT